MVTDICLIERPRLHGGRTRIFMCPACNVAHIFAVDLPSGNGWTFNDDYAAPTCAPSLAIRRPVVKGGKVSKGQHQTLCHLFLREGVIDYCNDCPHPLAGERVALPFFRDTFKINPGDRLFGRHGVEIENTEKAD